MSTCDYCHATIVWARTTTGRRIPLDLGENTAGNVALKRGTMSARVLRKGEEPGPGEVRAMTHFATCPDLPPGEPEPLSDAEFAQLTREALDLAAEAGIDPDDGKAEWAIRKLVTIEDEKARVKELADGWAKNIEGWRAEQLAPLAARRAFLEGALKDYMRRLRTEKHKSHPLPSGTLTSTGPSPKGPSTKIIVTDEPALVEWLRANATEDFDEVAPEKRSVLLTPLRALPCIAVHEPTMTVRDVNGEAVPGLAAQQIEVTYGVKVNR